MSHHQRRAVFITALPIERIAVLEHLHHVVEEPPLNGSIYRRGLFNERSEPWDVIVAEIGAFNENAAAETERVLSHYKPDAAIFVGVAGAIKDLVHGDVVASTKIYNYESGKDRDDYFETRPEVELSGFALLQRARHEAGEPQWRDRIKPGAQGALLDYTAQAKVGPIASGPKVLASKRTPTYKFIREHYGDALAVEMEGHGFLLGVKMNHPVLGLVVRGISDCIGDKNPNDDLNWQPVAARHAAAFAFQVIAKFAGSQAGFGKESSPYLRPYLDWLCRKFEMLEFRVFHTPNRPPAVPLDQVYVALKGEKTQRGKKAGKTNDAEELTLGDAFRNERKLVILGDPGMGKTTLATWLVLHLAKTLLEGGKTLDVLRCHVDPVAEISGETVSLGPARLPILVRVSEYVKHRKIEPELLLVNFLGRQTWYGDSLTYGREDKDNQGEKLPSKGLNELFREWLKRDQAVLILDGLDEITDPTDREDIEAAIYRFASDFLPTEILRGSEIILGQADTPGDVGGNQILITSRVTGYRHFPLRNDFSVVKVKPMAEVSARRFCEAWMKAVMASRSRSRKLTLESANEAISEAKELQQAIFESPQIRIRELAGNPLLLTILANVYHLNHGLPDQRFLLYKTAVDHFVATCQNRLRGTKLDVDELLHVLGGLATFVHENDATGVMEEKWVHAQVVRLLAQRSEAPNLRKVKEKADTFVRILQQDSGLFAAVEENKYAFLHLTFQEYLAAYGLVDTPSDAKTRILEKIAKPRWREPILLALGYASSEWDEQEFQNLSAELLAQYDPSTDLIDLQAILLSSAVLDMKALPTSQVRQIVLRLVSVYASRPGLDRVEALEEQIENNLSFIKEVYPDDVESALCEILRDFSGALHAAATLIDRLAWFNSVTAEALLRALPLDNSRWDWPIHRALRKIVSPLPKSIKRPSEPKAGDDLLKLERRLEQWDKYVCEIREDISKLKTATSNAEESVSDSDAFERIDSELFDYSRLEGIQSSTGPANIPIFFDPREQRGRLGRSLLVPGLHKGLAKDSEHLMMLQAYLERCESGAVQEALRAHVAAARAKHEEACAEFEKQKAAYLHELTHLKPVVYLSAASLPFKTALKENNELVTHIFKDRLWLQLVMGLFGGYTDYGTFQVTQEYKHFARLLSLPDRAREFKGSLLNVQDKWGIDDWVMGIALHLDNSTKFKGIHVEPAFSIEQIYRDSPLTKHLLPLLQARAKGVDLPSEISRVYETTDEHVLKGECLVALALLNVDVRGRLDIVNHDPSLADIVRYVTNRLGQIRSSLRDPILRIANKELIGDLKVLSKTVNPNQWIEVVRAVIQTLITYGADPLNVYPLLVDCPPAQRKYLLAEIWVYAFSGAGGDNQVYDAAVGLDTINSTSPDDLIDSFVLSGNSRTLAWSQFQSAWVFDAFVSPAGHRECIPHAVFTAIQNLPAEAIRHEFGHAAKTSLLNHLRPFAEAQHEQLAEFNAFGLECNLLSKNPHLSGSEKVNLLSVRAQALSLQSPYYACRALLRVGSILGYPVELTEQIYATALSISDHHSKAEILERLFPYVSMAKRDEIGRELNKAVERISDPLAKSIFLIRVGKLYDGVRRQTRWSQAVECLKDVASEEEQATVLAEFYHHFGDVEAVSDSFSEIVSSMRDPWCKAAATGQSNYALAEATAAISGQGVLTSLDFRWPLLTAAASMAQLQRLCPAEQNTMQLWAELGSSGNDEVARFLCERGYKQGLILSGEAAVALQALRKLGKQMLVHKLLPLVQNPEPDALSILERWVDESDRLLSLHSRLLLAENGRRITPRTIEGLLVLLQSREDRSRCRAIQVVRGTCTKVNRDRTMPVSSIGIEVVEMLFGFICSMRGVNDAAAGFVYQGCNDIIHDDPAAMMHWIRCIVDKTETSKIAEAIISDMMEMTEEVWNQIIFALSSSNDYQLHFASLTGIAKCLSASKPKFIEEGLTNYRINDEAAQNVLERLIEPTDVARAAVEAFKDFSNSDPDSFANKVEGLLGELLSELIAEFKSPENREAVLKAVGDTYWFVFNKGDDRAESAAQMVMQCAGLTAKLVSWLTTQLEAEQHQKTISKRTNQLLRIVAEVEKLDPTYFAQLDDGVLIRFTDLLARCCNSGESHFGKAAALRLLRHAPSPTKDILKVCRDSLLEGEEVLNAALSTMTRFRKFEEKLLPELLYGLFDESATVAYVISILLTRIARSDSTPPSIRTDILQHLTRAANHPDSRRSAYSIFGLGNDDSPLTMEHVVQLDQAFFRAVVQITSGAALS